MKLWHMIGILTIGVLFLYSDSGTVSHQRPQEQQEDPRIMEETLERLSYKVIYRSPGQDEDDLADIHWLRKAAEMAIKKGHPYFNVMDQRMIRSAKIKKGQGRNTVQGTIQLSPDPMGAEYDAQEILSLVLERHD